MTFELYSTSDVFKTSEREKVIINLSTLEELLDLQKQKGDLIIHNNNRIEVYDDYRE